jgi:hypothetical protein
VNQHYVPRVYLKNFATKVGKEFFIDVFDKIDNRYFKANIKKVCSESDFYTLSKDTSVAKDILAIEKVYGEHIEPMYSRAYKILTDDNISKISDMQRIEIILGVLHFRMRNPKILKNALAHHETSIASLYKESKERGLKGLTYDHEDFSFREYSLEQIIGLHAEKVIETFKENHILGTTQISNMHEFAKLEINISQEGSFFIASDNPLATEDYTTKLENPLARSSEFTFPLDNRHMLKILHDNTIEPYSIKRKVIPDGNVHLLNSTIYKQSSRFLFGPKEVFDNYFKLDKSLDEASDGLIMDLLEQIVKGIKPSIDTIDSYNILSEFYTKHKSQTNITHEEKQLMMRNMMVLAIEFRNSKLY